ncbi:serpin B5-like isoform X2 [Dendropsophus ebraccatus]|uniref:serpin B5-like isoform X2 n=1 Tax=Dendropsophus ebraccatus TaxID=150705 RepID=UPI0038316421
MEAFRLANAALAIDIFKNLNEKNKTESFIFSPFCISSSLALAFKGAKGNTATEIEKEFINSIKKPYPSELEQIDIKSQPEEAKNQINTSIKDLTNGNVKNLLTEGLINENTNMLLLGAASYKGSWLYKFNKSETKECEFHVTKTETKKVEMMQLDARLSIRTLNEQNLMILDIPFAGKQMSMLIIMPKSIEDDSTGLEKLEKELTSENYVKLTNPSMMGNSKVKLSFPKFKIESSHTLKDNLKSLGINDAFNEEVADFSVLSEKKGLSVSEAIYRASIDVDEEGSEAADVIRERVLMSKTECNVNHPFLFTVKHNKTQGILFFGRFTGPPVLS